MAIIRYPNTVNRGEKKFCQECQAEQRKGYWLFWREIMSEALFVCDACLKGARSQGVFEATAERKE